MTKRLLKAEAPLISKLFLLAVFCIAVLFFNVLSSAPTAHANSGTYYVSNSGSDSNNGTDPTTPWQTVAKVNSSAFNPGDQILFKRGDTWRELLTVPSSGVSGSPVVFGAYGSGNNPIITGSDLISGGWTQDSASASTTIFITSGTSWTVPSDWNNSANSIEVIGGGGASSDGNNSVHNGAGGGGGAYARATNVTLTPSASVTIAIGPGGKTDHASGGDTYLCNTLTTNCGSIAGSAVIAGAHGGTGATTNSTGAAGGSTSGGVGALLYAGGNGGTSTSGAGGGGGAAGPLGPGGTGGAGTGAAGGGGGNGGGSAGAAGVSSGGNGGTNKAGTGNGVGGSPGTAGTNGGGGGGNTFGTTADAGAGGVGTEWDATHGSGGGGGGATGAFNGGAGGLYGGAGGGSGGSSSLFGAGAQGIIVASYLAPTPHIWKAAVSTQPNIIYFNGTRGILVGSKASITAEYDWYWSGNTLYVYSPSGGDPSAYYTNPGIEAGSRNRALQTNNASYITVDGLTLRDGNSVTDNTVNIGSTSVVGVTLQNCVIERGAEVGLDLKGSSTAHDVTVNNCIIQNNAGWGIEVENQYATATVSNSTITGNGWRSAGDNQEYSGIEGQLGNMNIYGNMIFANEPNCAFSNAQCHGIYVDASPVNVNIYQNTLYGNTFGDGIKTRGSANIYENMIYNNYGSGIEVGGNGGTAISVSLSRNIIYNNNSTHTLTDGLLEGSKGSGSLALSILNNSIYGNSGTGNQELNITDDLTSLDIRNNIFYALPNRRTIKMVSQSGTVTINNNIDWRPDGNPNLMVGGASKTWAQWQALGFDTAGLNVDPAFTDPSAANFTLTAGSPAVNAGANLGSPYNLALDPTSTWPLNILTSDQNSNGSGWDIGAFVFPDTVIVPPTVGCGATCNTFTPNVSSGIGGSSHASVYTATPSPLPAVALAPVPVVSPALSVPFFVQIFHNYQIWDTGIEVHTLQVYLNTHGYLIALTGAGSSGHETYTFGTLTYKALVKYQRAHDLPPTGYLGPLTRASLSQ